MKLTSSNENISLFANNIDFLLESFLNFDVQNADKNTSMIYNGCSTLIGASLGDSMGSYCEFTGPNEANYKAIWAETNPIFATARGQLTDDTEMATSMALGILESLNKFGLGYPQQSDFKFKTHFIAYYYLFWFLSNPFDIGNTTRNALDVTNLNKIMKEKYDDEILISKMKSNSESRNSSSLSNGFLMRHTPMTVFLYYYFEINAKNTEANYFKRCVEEKQYEDLFLFLYNFILGEIQLTHFNLECALAAVVYDFLILSILTNKNPKENVSLNHLLSLIEFLEALLKSTNKQIENLKIKQSIKKILNSLNDINQMTDFEKESEKSELLKVGVDNIGYYMHAMNLTLFIVKFLQNFSNIKEFGIYRNIINFICNKGGDTDTNCCIVGGVIGAIIGIKDIETNYLETHLKFNPTDENNNQGREFIYAPSVLTFYGIKLFSVLNNQLFDGNESKKEKKELDSEDLSVSMIKNILTKDLKKEANKDYPLLSISELI